MKRWGPEPLGTYARARVGGYAATFYRGHVSLTISKHGHQITASPSWWTVYGCTVEKLLAGQQRQTSAHKRDEKRAPTAHVPKPNRFLTLRSTTKEHRYGGRAPRLSYDDNTWLWSHDPEVHEPE